MNAFPALRSPARCSSRSALTLLELVMVVSILAILTALVVPGMTDQNEETRKTVARATLQDIRDAIANRYINDMNGLPTPNILDNGSRISTTQVTGALTGTVPQLHFLFVNPNQFAAGSTPQYVSVNDFDSQARIGWNGPYLGTKSTTYPNPSAPRFPNDPNNGSKTWSDYGFTTLFGQQGDFCINDPWGSPYVLYVRPTAHGSSTLYTAYVVSAGFNRILDYASWTSNADGTLNSGDDLALQIKAWK
jgi:type II secretory pathway pseudopilin PulG